MGRRRRRRLAIGERVILLTLSTIILPPSTASSSPSFGAAFSARYWHGRYRAIAPLVGFCRANLACAGRCDSSGGRACAGAGPLGPLPTSEFTGRPDRRSSEKPTKEHSMMSAASAEAEAESAPGSGESADPRAMATTEVSAEYSATAAAASTSTDDDPSPVVAEAPPPAVVAAPLYVTVGPQCAGKTTALRSLLPNNNNNDNNNNNGDDCPHPPVTDVTIDDQPGVYVTLPLERFLHPDRYPHGRVVHNMTLRERVMHPSQAELRIVLSRLVGDLRTGRDFERELSTRVDSLSGELRGELVDAVEEVLRAASAVESRRRAAEEGGDPEDEDGPPRQKRAATGPPPPSRRLVPQTVDLFVVEGIFAGGALNSAVAQLRRVASEDPMMPMAWGNTNTRPREYENALDAASTSGRPVRFVAFGGAEAARRCLGPADDAGTATAAAPSTTSTSTPASVDGVAEIPRVDRRELLRRNVVRLCRTGRYVNAVAINDALGRTGDLLGAAVDLVSLERARRHREESTTDASSTSQTAVATTNGGGGGGERNETPARSSQTRQPQTQPPFVDFGDDGRLALDAALARLGGFDMGSDGTVVRIGRPRNITPSSSTAASSSSSLRGGGGGRNTNSRGWGPGPPARGRGRGGVGRGGYRHNNATAAAAAPSSYHRRGGGGGAGVARGRPGGGGGAWRSAGGGGGHDRGDGYRHGRGGGGGGGTHEGDRPRHRPDGRRGQQRRPGRGPEDARHP